MGRYDGKTVFITGASSGIGAALARVFAGEGADLALAARRTDRLAALAAELEERGRRALALTCDVARDGDLEAAAAKARDAFGRIDVVVANAGFGVVGNLETLGLDDYRRQFETNVFGLLRTVYATLDDLKKTRGQLVVVGSVVSYVSVSGSSPYAMSKFAARALAHSLGYELEEYGIGVTLVCPGYVESEFRQVDNQGQLRPGAEDPVPKWVVVPAECAAREILRAVWRRRREAVITGHGKLVVALQRFWPSLLSFLVRRFHIRHRGEPQ